AFRDGKRYVARLERLALDDAPPSSRRVRACTYLVTGGLGMLGLCVARWLAESLGVRTLVLTGRRAPSDDAQRAVKAIETLGARVHVIAADVAVEADVRRLMRAIRRLPPLKGVIHCAGVLQDGILEQMEWSRFTAVTAPKVRGTWLLHRYTRGCALDHFVVHSSLLSLTGSAGQGNYTAANAFLDAVVALRARAGQPALGINWGPWSEAGLGGAPGDPRGVGGAGGRRRPPSPGPRPPAFRPPARGWPRPGRGGRHRLARVLAPSRSPRALLCGSRSRALARGSRDSGQRRCGIA